MEDVPVEGRRRKAPNQAGSVGAARLRDGLGYCVGVFLVARVSLSLLGVFGVGSLPVDPLEAGERGAGNEVPATPGLHNAFDGTERWDAAWYLRIADEGYEGNITRAAFFPGYPISIRSAAILLDGSDLAAAVLVSNLAFLLALTVLHALTEDEYDRPTARRAVVLLTAFPTSFYFLAPYSESLFLLLTVLTFYAARRDRWGRAAIAGAAAALTRSIGIVLAPSLIAETIQQHRDSDRPIVPRAMASLGVLAGPVLYFAYWSAHGDIAAPLQAEASWYRQPTFPLIALGRATALGLRGLSSGNLYWTADLVLTLVLVVPVAFWWRRLRPAYLVYIGLSLLVPLSNSLPARPLASMPRFEIVLFPAFWVGALALMDRRRFRLVTVLSATTWCALALSFMNWHFVY